jgi:hypothetical protein
MSARSFDLLIHFDAPVHVMASAPSPDDWVARLSDVINAVFFQVPLWPMGIAAMPVRSRTRPGGSPHRFSLLPVAALAIGLQVATLLLTRSAQGESRDWDVRSALGATLGFCTASLLVEGTRSFEARRLWVGVGAAALAIAIALWSVMSVEAFQLARVAGHLAGQPAWTADQRSRALDFLGMHALNQGRFDESAEAWEQAIVSAPNPRYFYQAGLARLHGRRLEEARGLAMEAARRMPDKADPWWLLAAIARAAGDSAGTAAFMDSVRVRGSRTPPPGL